MIVANLATYPPRAEFLPRVVNAISPQVDQLNVVLNEYDSVPEILLKHANVNPIIPDHDTKDAGKFFPDCRQADFILLVDDDIIYPNDFVSLSVERMRKLGLGRYLGGYHCSIYRRPSLSPISWKSIKQNARFRVSPSRIAGCREFFHFGHDLESAVIVDQVATNAAILNVANMPSYEFMRSSQKFVDVRLARWCFEQGIVRVCLPRQKEWLQECSSEGVTFNETIVGGFTYKHHRHVADEIWRFAFRDPQVGHVLKP